MKIGTTNHPKFRSLMRELELPQYSVVGILESLWMLAAQFSDDGDLSKFNKTEISDYLGWDGCPNKLISTLIRFRWVDGDDTRLRVHDWDDHMPYFVAERLKKRAQRARKKTSEQQENETFLGLSQTVPGQSDLFKSSQDNNREGEISLFVESWNAVDGLKPITRLTDGRRKKLLTRLDDPDWDWKAALEKLPIKGGTWQPDFKWFTQNEENVLGILEGKYDWLAEKSVGKDSRDDADESARTQAAIARKQITTMRAPKERKDVPS